QGLSAPGPVSAVLATRDGSVWISTVAGLDRLHDGRLTHYIEPRPAASPMQPKAPGPRPAEATEVILGGGFRHVSATLFEDSRGRLWVAPYVKGFGYLEHDRFVAVAAVPEGFVDSIAED